MPSPVLALVGPTAAGKSSVALRVAEQIGAEIVAVDAFTIYRGMDVGTAKPSPSDSQRVAHHMVDVLDPDQRSSVEWFQGAARSAITDIRQRGVVPLLVGGSGLYFRAVVDDLEFPPTDPQVRARVRERVHGDPDRAYAELVRRDPDAASRIDSGNLRRCVRALEVLELTGRPFSGWRRGWDDYRSIYPTLRVVGIDVARDVLHERIARRTQSMLAHGLLEEAQRLLTRPMSRTARAAIGYAEAFAIVEQRGTDVPPHEVDALAEAITIRTRKFAVRQQRWFQADPRIRWVSRDDAADALVRLAEITEEG